VAGALAELAAARSGQRRALTYEVKQEDAVYDVVDEDQYAQIVAKRRMDAGRVVLHLQQQILAQQRSRHPLRTSYR
jgi:DNA polymerase alpha subunit A